MLSYQDIPPLLDRLDDIREKNPEHLTFTYQKVLNTPEGQLLLIDLMDRFFEFKPPMSEREVGSQAVLIYIKNNILGTVDLSYLKQPTEENTDAQQS